MGFDFTQGLNNEPLTETVQGELIQQLCVKGGLEMMKKLLGDLCIMHFEKLIIDTAAYYGHLEILKWIQGWIETVTQKQRNLPFVGVSIDRSNPPPNSLSFQGMIVTNIDYTEDPTDNRPNRVTF